MTRAALARFRAWWIEIFVMALCAMFIGIGVMQAGENRVSMLTLAGFTTFVYWAGWASCHRHKRLPLQETLNGVKQDVAATHDLLLAMADDAEDSGEPPARPPLSLVR